MDEIRTDRLNKADPVCGETQDFFVEYRQVHLSRADHAHAKSVHQFEAPEGRCGIHLRAVCGEYRRKMMKEKASGTRGWKKMHHVPLASISANQGSVDHPAALV